MKTQNSNEVSSLLGGISPEEFLKDYWQKKPLLIRNAFPDFLSPVTPEKLIEYACEDDVESRLIQQIDGENDWQLDYGPFNQEDFNNLPATHWTVLVQQVNRLHPEIGKLLDNFSFIPRWRIDDIMISYAPNEGGVGPHIDNYDVFLIQGRGQRRWQITRNPILQENLVPDLDVRILSDFVVDEDWILNPGDMLYLPPRIAHNGISLGDCMTLSVGFRAPSVQEMITGFYLDLAEEIEGTVRYSDPGIKPASVPGLIDQETIERVLKLISRYQPDEKTVTAWFGKHITANTRDYYPPYPEEELSLSEVNTFLNEGWGIRVDEGTHSAYAIQPNHLLDFFINGISFLLPDSSETLIKEITAGSTVPAHLVLDHFQTPEISECLLSLLNEGLIRFEKGK